MLFGIALEGSPSTAEIIRDASGLEAIVPEWRRLAFDRGNAFVTPEWFEAWWGHYGQRHESLVVAVHGPTGVIGVVPLVAERRRPHTQRFAGSSLGDHFHPAAGEADEVAVARAAGVALAASRRGSPPLVLDNVEASADWWPELARGALPRPVLFRVRTAVLPGARIENLSWEEYLGSLSRNLRSQLARKRRRLEQDHRVEVRWTREEVQVERDMATLFRLHDLRWARRSGGSSLTSATARAFLTDFARAAQRRGWLRLGFLEIDGEAGAAWCGWRLGRRFTYYQAGFDPRWAEHSVGLLLFAATIEAAIAEGAGEYDMLLGDEAFKTRFADSARSVCTIAATSRFNPRRIALAAEVGARRAVRSLPPRVREPLRRGAATASERLTLGRRR